MIKNIVFDFGGVLIDWNPRYLFDKLFASANDMEYFLNNICTYEWNEQQDAGRTLKAGTIEKQEEFPEHAEMIENYYKRWPEMLNGAIQENSSLIPKLKPNYKLLGLTNWSAETFPIAYEKYNFLKELEGIVVSGEEKLKKPDSQIFQILIDRYKIQPNESVFIDDSEKNIAAAMEIGFKCIHYNDNNLKEELEALGVQF